MIETLIDRTNDTYIRTATGRMAWPLNPHPDDIHIEDIASSLAKICRFNGHTRSFYSVAQHSVLVSQIVPPVFALTGLLHDASEAYLCDVPSPLKRHFAGYREMEDRLMHVISGKLGFFWPCGPEVKHADLVLLATEQRDLIRNSVPLEGLKVYGIEPLESFIEPWAPETAKFHFQLRYRELSNGR